MRLNLAFVALAVIIGLCAVNAAEANFGQALGFSGRGGATCIACHTPTPVMHPSAKVTLSGLPSAWDPGATYSLTIHISGGPQALPAPQPQGGFTMASNGGQFHIVPGTERLLLLNGPTEISYQPEGTLYREWQTAWQAPDLTYKPQPVQFWLAGIAANGNHVILAGSTDTGGERFDSEDHITRILEPSAAAHAQWRAIPLRDPTATVSLKGHEALIEGRHTDENATTLAFSIDGSTWQTRQTGAAWRIALPSIGDGPHRMLIRSEGADRSSANISLDYSPGSGLLTLNSRDVPSTPFATTALLVAALAILTRRIAL